MSSSMAKCKALHLNTGNSRCEYIRRRIPQEQPRWEELRGSDGQKAGHKPAVYSSSLEDKQYPGLQQKRDGWQGEEGDFLLLLYPPKDLSGVLRLRLGPPLQERCQTVGAGPEESHKGDQRTGVPLLWRQTWACLARSSRENCQGLKGAYKQEGDQFFTWSNRNRTRGNGFKLKERIFRLDVRKMLGWWGAGACCSESLCVSSMEAFKARMNKILGSLI